MTKFKIEAWSDTACPWSYIGKRYLDQAIAEYTAEHPDAEFEMVHHPYYLFPDAKVSLTWRAYLGASILNQHCNRQTAYKKAAPIAQIAGVDRAPTIIARMEEMGRALGIDFSWDGLTGNTRDSHKLVLLARDRDADVAADLKPLPRRMHWQHDLLEALYRGGMEDGRDISDRAFLVETAVSIGLAADEEEALAWLNSDEAGRIADKEAAMGREMHIQAVPSYLVQGRHLVGGCQEAGVFLQLFDKIDRLQEGTKA